MTMDDDDNEVQFISAAAKLYYGNATENMNC